MRYDMQPLYAMFYAMLSLMLIIITFIAMIRYAMICDSRLISLTMPLRATYAAIIAATPPSITPLFRHRFFALPRHEAREEWRLPSRFCSSMLICYMAVLPLVRPVAPLFSFIHDVLLLGAKRLLARCAAAGVAVAQRCAISFIRSFR